MPFIRNAWYMAGWSENLLAEPYPITVLEEPLVLYRLGSGSIAALHDTCPHRAVPLSLGTVKADRIRCPYHGLEFDSDGVCQRNPHVKGPSQQLKIRHYPTLERYGAVWIWMGEGKGDPSALTDYGWMTDGGLTIGHGYLLIEADYRLIIDNLMDLAHTPYIHPNTVGIPGAADVEQANIIREAGAISVNTLLPELPPSVLNRQICNASGRPALRGIERIDQYQDMMWQAPSHLTLVLGSAPPGAPRAEGVDVYTAHILTPGTKGSTHYFFSAGRDFERDNDELTDQLMAMGSFTFEQEDKPMLEAAQRRVDAGAKLLNLTVGDAGSGQVRRELTRLLAQESAQ